MSSWICGRQLLLACLLLSASVTAKAQDVFDPESLDFERTKPAQTDMQSKESAKSSDKKKNKSGKTEIDALLMVEALKLEGVLVEEDPLVRARVRRARIDISRDLDARLKADLSFDIDDEDEEIGVRKATLEYDHEGGGRLEIGLFKPEFGLEQSTSSRKLRTLERSMASDAFSPDPGIGVAWSRTSPRFTVALGAFLDREQDDTHDITARVAVAPLMVGPKGRTALLHLGAGVVWHSGDEDEFRIRQSGGVDSAENFLRSGEYTVSGTTTVGGEAALVWRSLSIQGEWMLQSLTLDTELTEDEPQFEGGYIQVAWLFGGARRAYSEGVFDRVRSVDGLPLELVANYSLLDARFDGVGNEAEQWSLGLNYRINRNARIMGHVVNALRIERNEPDDDGRGVVVRLQIDL